MTMGGGCSIPRNKLFCGGNLSKWIFAQGRSTRSLWCLEQIQRPIWRSKDHLVMKGLSKNAKNHEDPGSISTQNMFPLISVVPNPLNCHMWQNLFRFFQLCPLLDPCWPRIQPNNFAKGSAVNRFGFSVTPIYRKTREVQFAASGRQIAPTFPYTDDRFFGNAHLL